MRILALLAVFAVAGCSNIPGYHGIQNETGLKEELRNCIVDILDTRNNRGSGCS
jgi:hypothetical protein